jgi:hypothetical protein
MLAPLAVNGPPGDRRKGRGGTPMVKSSNQGQVSVANGVVYAGTVDVVGTMYARARTDC